MPTIEQAKAMRKAEVSARVELLAGTFPEVNTRRCRAQVRIYVGQRRLGGTWTQCGNRHRPGRLTCGRHADRE